MAAHRIFLLLLLSYSFSAMAAVTNTIDTANSNSANASSTNNAQSINFNSQPANHTTNTLETTVQPMVGGFSSSFSSDYCGATMQASAGAVGFGFSAGGPKIDGSCLMLRTFERTQQAASAIAPSDPTMAATLREASLEILGLIDPKVHDIFERKGLIEAKTAESKSQATPTAFNPSPTQSPNNIFGNPLKINESIETTNTDPAAGIKNSAGAK